MQLITHKSVSSAQNYSDKSDGFQTPGWVSALFVKLPQTSKMIRREKKRKKQPVALDKRVLFTYFKASKNLAVQSPTTGGRCNPKEF